MLEVWKLWGSKVYERNFRSLKPKGQVGLRGHVAWCLLQEDRSCNSETDVKRSGVTIFGPCSAYL